MRKFKAIPYLDLRGIWVERKSLLFEYENKSIFQIIAQAYALFPYYQSS